WSADRHAPRRSAALAAAGCANREVRVPRGAPGLRPPPFLRLRRAEARRQDISLVGPRPRRLARHGCDGARRNNPSLSRSPQNMPATIIDSAIFGNLFSTEAMRQVWSDENRTRKYLDIEAGMFCGLLLREGLFRRAPSHP